MSKKLTQEEFINRCNIIHDFKYDYSLVKYHGHAYFIIIICLKHGNFKQLANKHISGRGCRNCSYEQRGNNRKLTLNCFINKANLIHNFKYNYSKTEYINTKSKIIIICPEHGEFLQYPSHHLREIGCQKCSNLLMGWSDKNWKNQAKNSKHFNSFKVYIIRCWNEEEEFYKIGKTFVKLTKRFHSKQSMPYNYEIIKIYESKSQAKKISNLERELHKKNYKFKYVPKMYFEGMGECFNKIEL